MLLTAAMIVRDEERFLDGCLASLAGVVDEVVIADTGSTDRSRQIAELHGARVLDFPWRDDFAAARNAALDAARGEWILYIDADERVRDTDRSRLAAELSDRRLAACTVRFRPLRGFTRYREHRLFRNDRRLRFRGLIHESHLPALNELMHDTGMGVGESHLAIDHEGYEGDLSHKHRRNRPLLEARLQADPEHVYSWGHLGATLAALGETTAARAALESGLRVVRSRWPPGPTDSLIYIALANLLLDQAETADALLAEGLAAFPDQWTLVWLQARQHLAGGRFAAALPLLERLTAIDGAALCEGQIAHDQSIFGALAWDATGLCYFRLGELAASATAYGRAEEAAAAAGDTQGQLEYRTKRQLAEVRAKLAAAPRH